MTTHDQVHLLCRIQKSLMQIKELSTNGQIDKLCLKAISDVVDIGDSLHPELIREFKNNHADPMA